MRLWILILWLLIAVTVHALDTALSSAELDKVAYFLVATRNEPHTISIFLPTFGYGRQEEIQFVVVAVPYTPSDTNPNLLSSLVTALADRNWDKAAQLLSNFRNVYLPYETFKIKLIFVFFVRTKTLIDLGVDSIREIAQGKGVDQNVMNMWPVYYASGIFQIMSANIEKYGVIEKINKWKEEYKINEKSIEVNYEDTLEIPLQNSIIMKIRTLNVKTNKFTVNNIVVIRYFYDTNEKKAWCDIEYYRNSIGNKYIEYTNEIYTKSIDLIKNRILPSVDQLRLLFTVEDNKLKDFSFSLNETVIIHFSNTLKRETLVPNQEILWYQSMRSQKDSCDLNQVTQNYKDVIVEDISTLDSFLQNYINAIANRIEIEIVSWNKILLNSFSNALTNVNDKDLANYISQTLGSANTNFVNNVIKGMSEVAVECAFEYAKSMAKVAGNKLASSVPFAGWAYAIANGIVGALQNIIYVDGEITVKNIIYNRFNNMLYNVSSPNICSPGVEIREVAGTSFKSGPSLTEAIFASIKGFFSALFNLFTGSEALDLIPIVREVDVPPDNYYFMVSSKPGVYAITIKLDVKSLIGKIKSQIKDSIKSHLIKWSLTFVHTCLRDVDTCQKEGELFNKVVNLIKMNIDVNLLGKVEFDNVFSHTNYNIDTNYNSDKDGRTEVVVYVVSFSPYAYGVKSYLDGSNSKLYYSYRFVYDWFSFFRPIIYDAFGIVRSKSSCDNTQSSGYKSSSTSSLASIDDQVSGACNEVLNKAIDSVIKEASNYISRISDFEISINEAKKCSIAGFIAIGAKSLLNELKNTLVNEISSRIRGSIIGATSRFCGEDVKTASSEIKSRFSSLLGGTSFLVNFFGAGVGEESDPMSLGCGLRRSLGYLASPVLGVVEDYSYLPSYLLSRISISPPVTTVVKKCYAVVTSPYFVYPQRATVAKENLPELLLKYSEDLLRINYQNINLGEKLFEILTRHHIIIIGTVRTDIPLISALSSIIPQQIILSPAEVNGEYCIVLRGPNGEVRRTLACYKDLSSFFRSAEYQIYVKFMESTYHYYYESNYNSKYKFTIDIKMINSPVDQILQDQEFQNYIMPMLAGLMIDRRGVTLIHLGGVNTYFTAFKIYPAIAVWERLDDLNAYYMVIPYSAPARELFVLGTVGDYVLFDGEPKRTDNKPFLYVDLVGGSGR